MRLLRWEVMLLLLLGLSLLVNSGSSSTCHGDDADDDGPSFTKAEALRKQSVAEGTDRDPAVQQQVFDVYRASLACDPQDGRSWMMLAFLSPFDSDRALLAAAPAGFVYVSIDPALGADAAAAMAMVSAVLRNMVIRKTGEN